MLLSARLQQGVTGGVWTCRGGGSRVWASVQGLWSHKGPALPVVRSGRSGSQSCSSLFQCEPCRIPLIGCTQTRSFSPPTRWSSGLLTCRLSLLPCIESGTWPWGCTHTHTESRAHHGSYSQRVPRLPAEHGRHRGGAAPLPPGAELGAHVPAAPVRDPRCYGIASGGFQRGDLITPDGLPARGRLHGTLCGPWDTLQSHCVPSAEVYSGFGSARKYLSPNTTRVQKHLRNFITP